MVISKYEKDKRKKTLCICTEKYKTIHSLKNYIKAAILLQWKLLCLAGS